MTFRREVEKNTKEGVRRRCSNAPKCSQLINGPQRRRRLKDMLQGLPLRPRLKTLPSSGGCGFHLRVGNPVGELRSGMHEANNSNKMCYSDGAGYPSPLSVKDRTVALIKGNICAQPTTQQSTSKHVPSMKTAVR